MSAAPVTIGSLYSGIAGLEVGTLAAFAEASIPARLAWQVERDPFCTRVLAHHFPDVTRYGDVESVSQPEAVDVLVGGFACQDVSSAGKGAGLGIETRSGFTLYHLLRIIDEILPPYLIIENVASGAKRWLPRVVQELVDRGYRPRAVPLGAIDVGAPHRRLRVFVVADRDGAASRWIGGVRDGERAPLGHDSGGRREGLVANGGSRRCGSGRGQQEHEGQPNARLRGALPDAERGELWEQPGRRGGARGAGARVPGEHGAELADTAEQGRERTDGGVESSGERRPPLKPERCGDAGSDGGTPQPGVGGDAHGLPFDVAGHAFPAGRGEAQYAWEATRAVGSDVKMPDRPAKLRALGNAVVPQCGLVVGRVLVAMGAPW